MRGAHISILLATLVLATPAVHSQQATERWTIEPDLEIPKSEFPGEYPVAGNIAVGQDGRMYISLPFRYEVAIFEASGEFVKTFGGEGDEPGKLRTQVMPFSWRGDSPPCGRKCGSSFMWCHSRWISKRSE